MYVQEFHYGMDTISQNITWSVSIEEQFYLFWPLLFLLSPKHWLKGIFLVILVSLSFRYMNRGNGFILYFHTLGVMVDLCIGAVFAFFAQKVNWFRKFFAASSTIHHLGFFIFLFVIHFFGTKYIFGDLDIVFNRAMYAIAFALIICSQALTTNKSFFNLGNFSFAQSWGKYTYGIYLLHPIVITIFGVLLELVGLEKMGSINIYMYTLRAFCIFILTLFISWLSYTYFEARFLKLKKKFSVILTT